MAAADPERRREIAAAGGRKRAANGNTEAISAAGRAGAAAIHTPAAYAQRIVDRWPTTGQAERAKVLGILAEIMPK